LKDVVYAKIFPPIGIARIGDSGFNLDTGLADGEIKYFFPSEIPGSETLPPELNGNFRDEQGRIKRQAVRFRVYGYDANGRILGELHKENGFQLLWSVHVANKKASFLEFRGRYDKPPNTNLRNPDVDDRTKLEINPEVKEISSGDPPASLTGKFWGSMEQPTDVCLGEIRTDDCGRLVFIPGAGYSRSVADPQKPHFQPDIISEFDSINWIDDVCDGWVDVRVVPLDTTALPVDTVHKATVITGSPRFAWGVRSPTTLWDILEELYKESDMKWTDHTGTNFYQDIWPNFYGTYTISWVHEKASQGHGPLGHGNFLPMESQLADTSQNASQLRNSVFERLRKPNFQDPTQATTTFMPRLSGDGGDAFEPGQPLTSRERPIESFSALTKLQYDRFKDWADGKFDATPLPGPFTRIEDVDLRLQPSFLTRAVLDETIGDPLYPGIELDWRAKETGFYVFNQGGVVFNDNRDPPFRVDYSKVKPGDLTRGLSLPWQSDFSQCNTHWWPTARPDEVIPFDDWPPGERVISQDTYIEYVASRKRSWTWGLRDTPEYPTEFYPGSTDMIRSWQCLGFITKQEGLAITDKSGMNLPVWLETEAKDKRGRGLDQFTLHF